MKYAHLIAYVMSRPWAMEPKKMQALIEALRIKADGGELPVNLEANNGGVPYMAHEARIRQDSADRIAKKPGTVAVLPVRGVLSYRMGTLEESSGNTTYERLGMSLRELVGNEQVKAIVMDVDSPGGVTDGLPEFVETMRSLKGTKPIVAAVNTMAASAAYWIASQADDAAVSPSGEVGSIGVWTMHEDISGFLEANGVKETLIYAGEYKVEGNPYEPLSDDAKAAIQSQVDTFYGMFVDGVAEGRKRDSGYVREHFGKGRMVLAEDAVKVGMADRVASLEQTLNRYGASMYGESPRRKSNQARQNALRNARSGRR